jgi:hypothetical protein
MTILNAAQEAQGQAVTFITNAALTFGQCSNYFSPSIGWTSGKTPLLAAAAKYFSNLEARGADSKTIRTYRTGVITGP